MTYLLALLVCEGWGNCYYDPAHQVEYRDREACVAAARVENEKRDWRGFRYCLPKKT
jgi:hypothetical protein